MVAALSLYRAWFLASVFLAFSLLPTFFSVRAFHANFHWPVNEPPGWWTAFKTWDAQHYLAIAAEGYGVSPESAEFFPLWPLLIRFTAPLCGGSHLAAALLLANVASIAGLAFLHDLWSARHGARKADLAVALALAFPGALFFAFPYSESLFLLLGAVFFASAHRRRWWGVALAAALMPLCRGIGVLIVVPLAHEVWRARRDGTLDRGRALALLAAPLAGIAAYLVVMGFEAGDPLAILRVQSGFIGGQSGWRLLDLPGFVRALLAVDSVHGMLGSALDRLFFVVAVALLFRSYRLDRTDFLFLFVMGVAPALLRHFWGHTRFLAVALPMFVAAADLLDGKERRLWSWLVLASLLSLQGLLLLRHVNNLWAG